MDKSPDAFRTISEVADELDLPQHVLRFWESKFSQIKPMKRGGGRRYYRPAEIELLRGIRHLLYTEGYTIKGVQKILREQGARHVVDSMLEPEVDVKSNTEPQGGRDSTAKTAPAGRATGPVSSGVSKKTIRNLKAILVDLKEAREAINEAGKAL